MKPIRVAVVGAGHLGSIHARIYSQLQEAQLVAVCDRLPERAQAVAGPLHCRPVSDFRELIGQVDAVSVAVPTQAHYEVAKEFLARGVHTLVEKPMTSTLPEADRLLALARKTKAVLQVGHVERFNAALRRVQDTLKNPRFIEVHRLAPFQPRGTEVGVVLDLMIHDIDLLLWLVRSPVRRVEAVGVRVLTPHEDIANARVTFRNGTVANLTASRISKEALRKFRIFQPDGYVSMDFLGLSVDLYRHEAGQIQHEHLTLTGEEPLKTELAGFLDAIRHRTPPPVSGREARNALAMALKITALIKKNPP
ncbi:MAG: Gfo/Idh/MocA family oxidoreductase [Candidatus Omnitrophota bacterium]|nr:Gfo/Idh/MocA family oxidoreductase [Candidatus Omnitrophota bacterium]